FSTPSDEALSECDLVFFATPNGIAMHSAPVLVDNGTKVIDLAADFRIKAVSVWEKWYGMRHASPQLVEEAVYGLPELNRAAIRQARLVANPGCYPTAVILGLLPLLESGLVDPESIIADAKSGVSGAGRKAEVHTLLAEAADNFKAYAVSGHRHQPEIAQVLSLIGKTAISPTFVPHLLPMIRGIHATLYAILTAEADLQQLYSKRYAHEPFVDVMPAGTHPETRSVRGANTCRIALHRPGNGKRVVVLSVIDNLVKGAAGQAVQNMNLMLGLAEQTALRQPGLLP
ncbi:MAG: N-acetyl-gamma-glutamyl-phosphate reductase, partial [Thiothrix sp.]